MRKSIAAVVPLIALAGCVQPRMVYVPPAGPRPLPIFSGQAGAFSGQRQRVEFIVSINPDCTPVGERVDLLAKPAHGIVEIVPGQDFASFPPANPRSKCNDRRLPGTMIYYTSDADYRGLDTFTETVLSTNGQTRTTQVNVTVR